MSKKTKTVSWFSAGVSSAVATKLAIEKIDQIIYIHINDQHPDTLRFVRDCEKWFGMKIQTMQSPYTTVNDALLGAGFVSGPKRGAACSRILKRRVRREWELKQVGKLRYVWGMDKDEARRQERIESSMPEQEHLFPLIEKGIPKHGVHKMLKASGIKRPAMYSLGYHNNNCIGCVRGGMGYWNKIREDFPKVFKRRAKVERRIGGSCINGIFLDELDKNAGRHSGPICEDCGIMCEIIGL